MVEKSRISIDPEICGGKPVITNTRVLVSVILEGIEQGYTFDEITCVFPSITIQDVQAAISYARMVIEGESIEFYSSNEISTGGKCHPWPLGDFSVKKFVNNRYTERGDERDKKWGACSYLRQNDYVLITCDKEFLSLWSFHKIKVILIDIHPATDPFIISKFNQFFRTFKKKLPESSLIILREKEFKVRTL